MIRLLTVRATVAALKRALAISDRLRPVTWRTLAVALAALAALSFWGYARTSRKYERALSALSDKTPFLNAREWAAAETDEAGPSLEMSFPFSLEWDATPMASSYVDFLPRHAFSAGGRRLVTGQSRVVLWSRPATVAEFGTTTYFLTSSVASTAKPFLSARAVAGAVGGQPRFVSLYAHLARPEHAPRVSPSHLHFAPGRGVAAFGSPSAAAWWGEGFNLLRLLRDIPSAPPRLSPPDDTSFLSALQRWALLVQAIVLTIGSILASVFGLIACYRGAVELALKRKQLQLANLEIEDRERARAEQALRFRMLQMDVEDRERQRAEEAARRLEEAARLAAAEQRILVVSY